MNGELVVICYFTTVGFIDIELVSTNHGIDDRTSLPFHGYNFRVSIKKVVFILFWASKSISVMFLHMHKSLIVISYH